MATNVPNHLGLILDGNRRWAKQLGLPATKGHQKGSEVLMDVSLAAFDEGIKYLSVFVFSTENWKRSKTEVSFILKLLAQLVKKNLHIFNEKNIKVVILGSPNNVPANLMGVLHDAQIKTAQNTSGTMAFCFNYGGKQELVDAVKKIVASGISSESINAQLITDNIYHPEIPPIDLLIRTSGEHRTSGFMMWRADYAELLIVDKLWPDFSVLDLEQALTDYAHRQRRFGV